MDTRSMAKILFCQLHRTYIELTIVLRRQFNHKSVQDFVHRSLVPDYEIKIRDGICAEKHVHTQDTLNQKQSLINMRTTKNLVSASLQITSSIAIANKNCWA